MNWVCHFLCRCHIRVIDTFGTEPAYNHEEYATLHGYRTNWGYWNLNARQYMTMFRMYYIIIIIIIVNFYIICRIHHQLENWCFCTSSLHAYMHRHTFKGLSLIDIHSKYNKMTPFQCFHFSDRSDCSFILIWSSVFNTAIFSNSSF